MEAQTETFIMDEGLKATTPYSPHVAGFQQTCIPSKIYCVWHKVVLCPSSGCNLSPCQTLSESVQRLTR